MIEWTIPIYLLRFVTAAFSYEGKLYIPEIPFGDFSKSKNITLEMLREYEPLLYHRFAVHEKRCNCFAQFDIFYPEKSDTLQYHFGSFANDPMYIQEKDIIGNK